MWSTILGVQLRGGWQSKNSKCVQVGIARKFGASDVTATICLLVRGNSSGRRNVSG